jgi:hypothetical protein
MGRALTFHTTSSASKARGGRVRPQVLMLAAALCALMAALALCGTAQAAESCPNEAARVGPSATLSECRVYEQVTPVDKGDAIDLFDSSGFLPTAGSRAFVAEDGDAILLQVKSSFGVASPTLNAAYVFSRGAAGWGMSVLAPPVPQPQEVEAEVFDPFDLSAVGFKDTSGTVSELLEGDPSAYERTRLLGPTGGQYTPLQSLGGLEALHREGELHFAGGSENLSHVVLEGKNHVLSPVAVEQDPESEALYESVGSGECSAQSAGCKLVNLNNEGKLLGLCGAVLGQGNGELDPVGAAYGAVSSDGSKVFFTSPDPRGSGSGCFNKPQTGPPENPPELYMREDGARTVEISIPHESGVEVGTPENPLLPAVFVGASGDGSKVFFMTKTQLTQDDTGHAPALYEYDTVTGTLTLISGGETETVEGDVDSVGAVSRDGSAVYFTAFGKLTAAPGAEALAPGGEFSPVNLYRYDTLTKITTYITKLNAADYPLGFEETTFNNSWYTEEFGGKGGGHELEGVDDWKEWYTTANGQYLVFGTIRPITGYDNQNSDPDAPCPSNYPGSVAPDRCIELYRYDAVTGKIACVSCAGGAPIDGAYFGRAHLEADAAGPPRPISEDGSDVFFDSANALVPQATPGRVHVYEWHEGAISLISSPSDPSNAFFLGSSAEGNDVFFTTHAQLALTDTDQSADVYDARVDGGFAQLALPQCTGAGCQGVPAATPVFATPASATFEGVGNFPGSQPPVASASKPTAKAKVKKCKRGFVKKHSKCVKVKKIAKKSAKGRM